MLSSLIGCFDFYLISNHRIISITKTHVTFNYLDRKINKTETKTIKGEYFIHLFLQHILPFSFTKIRHYGFLSSRSKTANLYIIRKVLKVKSPRLKPALTTRQIIIQTKGINPYVCTKCKKGMMVIIEIFAGIRGSPRRHFAKDKLINIQTVAKSF